MKLLLDQGLPRSSVPRLVPAGFEAVHVGDVGLATADDVVILAHARDPGQVVVTLDADFHAHLARSGADAPSVVRLRVEGLRADATAALLTRVLGACREALAAGAVVTANLDQARVRRLPLERPSPWSLDPSTRPVALPPRSRASSLASSEFSPACPSCLSVTTGGTPRSSAQVQWVFRRA